ncbi:MAG: glutamate synthase [Candidatus Poribacteria bacterium]|nr:glutamate synthase [Candidatus Poribacteria bacterium]
MAEIVCVGKTTRDINVEIKRLIARGETDIRVKNPGARHNLGVAILESVELTFDGSVGYYCAGMIDGPTVKVRGSTGWGLAESMMDGTVIVEGSAGNGAAASIRGGTVIIHGDAAARLGVSMKGGLILVGGNCGYMAGFMAQKGTLIVCGDAGEAFADSMYEGICFVGGSIAELGNDAVIEKPTAEDLAFLESTLSRYLPQKIEIHDFKKVISGRKLWNFDKDERAVWREAL